MCSIIVLANKHGGYSFASWFTESICKTRRHIFYNHWFDSWYAIEGPITDDNSLQRKLIYLLHSFSEIITAVVEVKSHVIWCGRGLWLRNEEQRHKYRVVQ